MSQRDEQQKRRPEKTPAKDRQDWRRRNADAAGSTPKKDVKGWFRTGQSHAGYSRYRRFIGLGIGTAALMLSLLIWFYLVSLSHPQVPLLTLVVTEYESAILPPNAFAREDEDLFKRLFKRDRGLGITRNVGCISLGDGDRYRGRCSRADALNKLKKELDDEDLKPGGPDKNTIMLYVSAHGVVNDKGDACLLLTDSNPLDTTTWLPVKELLGWLRKNPKLETCKWVVFLACVANARQLANGHCCTTTSRID